MTSDSDDYMAVSISPESYTIEDIYDNMTREGSTVTKAEALAGFEEVTQSIIKLVEQGHSVATPLVNIRPGISGVFEGQEDSFDNKRHEININVTAGQRLRKAAGEIDIEKVSPRERVPVPLHYYDNTSEEQDQTITPGDGARITGSLLKFDEEDDNQGVFFVNVDGGAETRVDTKMLRNMPGELIFSNPDLSAGTYRLEIRAILKHTSDIRIGMLSDELTVSGS